MEVQACLLNNDEVCCIHPPAVIKQYVLLMSEDRVKLGEENVYRILYMSDKCYMTC